MHALCDITKTACFIVETPEEVEKTALLADEIWHEYYPQILGDAQVEYMTATYQSADAISKGIENGCVYYILRYDGEDAGYFAFEPDNPKGKLFISKIYIKSCFRGKGLGRYVYTKAVEMARQAGINTLWLTVNKGNSASIAAYEKLGFVTVADTVTSIGNGFVMDDYVMEREI